MTTEELNFDEQNGYWLGVYAGRIEELKAHIQTLEHILKIANMTESSPGWLIRTLSEGPVSHLATARDHLKRLEQIQKDLETRWRAFRAEKVLQDKADSDYESYRETLQIEADQEIPF